MKSTPTLRWNPLKEMEDMQQRMTAGREPDTEQLEHALHEERLRTADWMPLVDLTEDGRQYVIKADLPARKKTVLRITCEDGVLNLMGEGESGAATHRKRRHSASAPGRFFRSFALPDDADPTHLAAEFKEGLLVLHLPKNDTARPKVLEVAIT